MKRWRSIYYAAWLVPVLVASFLNYVVSLESDPGASWPRYLLIHLFYWLAWAVAGELMLAGTPMRISAGREALSRFVRHQLPLLALVLLYFSVYYWALNRRSFDPGATFADTVVQMLVSSGPLLFHVMNVITFLVLLGGCLLVRQAQNLREQEEERARLEVQSRSLEARLAESKLTALNNQIHPHFLFNAMNTIASLIAARQPDEAYRAVTQLAGLLRKSFEYARSNRISLADEMELVSLLLQTGKLRFDQRLSWSLDVPASVQPLMLPPFLIEPLVENALRHGVENTDAAVHISVRAELADDTLLIEVADDGPGCTMDGAGGVGLRNLRERMALMQPRGSGPDIETAPGAGFRVRLAIPGAVDG